MQMILLAGAAGVGKTLLANLIAKQAFDLGMVPKLVSFAGKLKSMAEEEGFNKSTHPIEYREYCQSLGKRMRDSDPSYWLKKFKTEISQYKKDEDEDIAEDKNFWERCIIVDDCRYANELDLGREMNAVLIFLSFGSRKSPNANKEWMSHESEAMAESIEKDIRSVDTVFDYMIENDGTLKDLEDMSVEMSPHWCGIRVDGDTRMDKISQCVEDLIDLLFFEEDDNETEGAD